MSPVHEELESLLFDWEAGTLDANGVERIREILRSDQDAQTWFVQQQLLTAALKQDADAGLTATNSITRQQNTQLSVAAETDAPVSRNRKTGIRTTLAAILLIGVLAGRIVYLEMGDSGAVSVAETSRQSAGKEATSRGIALLTRLVDIEWSAEQSPLEVGEALPPGRLAIASGYAQVEFFCGATVVLEGPAELDLKSPTLAKVKHGRLRAQVPPAARGFSLEVDDMKVVDLGTEFGLSVSPEGADVQVFDGEIEVHDAKAEIRNLTSGQAVSRSTDGSYADTNLTPELFLDIDALEGHADRQETARFQRWKSATERLKRDSRLIAYYTFDQAGSWQRRLKSSLEPANTELDGAIVGAGRVSGRWATKGGLEFKQPGDRVRVQIDGEYGSLTFACWVRIDSLDRQFNSLFLTDNYNEGEPHWQILDTGQLYFSVRPARQGQQGPRDHKVLSPPFWKPSMSGRWLHLATTCDIETATVVHYLNGAVLHTEHVPTARIPKTTRIGSASVGNWALPTKPSSEFAIRNLNGSMDEFAIFAEALTAGEIQEMFNDGKP